MEYKKAKEICKDFIDENRSRRIILHDAIETVILTSDTLQKENEILKNYLAQQHLINDYVKFRRSNK